MHIRTFKVIILITIVAGLSSCMKTVTMQAMRPAAITFPSHVNTLLIVDRTKFENKKIAVIEGILTGELPGEDRMGVQEAINTLHQKLQASPRFSVKRASEVLNGNSINDLFPNELSWDQINQLCTKYEADAIIALELFDTDFIITNGKRKAKKQIEENGQKKEVEVDEFFAEGVGKATIGYRLYDKAQKQVMDQKLFTNTNTWTAVGSSARDAAMHLIAKSEATKYVSRYAAAAYATRITPTPIWISREFYKKSRKCPALAIGTRQADVNRWQDALKTWEQGLSTARRKEGGKLSYNIAIAYEVLGEFDNAKKWASKSYTDYGNKKGQPYLYSLNRRSAQEDILKQQMQ